MYFVLYSISVICPRFPHCGKLATLPYQFTPIAPPHILTLWTFNTWWLLNQTLNKNSLSYPFPIILEVFWVVLSKMWEKYCISDELNNLLSSHIILNQKYLFVVSAFRSAFECFWKKRTVLSKITSTFCTSMFYSVPWVDQTGFELAEFCTLRACGRTARLLHALNIMKY